MIDLPITVQGNGPDLVLLHGWGMNADVWQPLLGVLKKSFRVTCVDLPGHGNSDYAKPWQLEEVVEALSFQLPAKFSLLGWSLGGMIGLAFAAKYPGRLNKLILLAASAKFTQAADWPHAQSKQTLNSFMQSLAKSPQMAIKRFLLLQTRGMEETKSINKWLKAFIDGGVFPKLAALESGLNILANTDLRAQLAEIELPVLMLLGEQDQLVPAAVIADSQGLKPTLKAVIIKGSAHLPFISHTEQSGVEIKHFIDKSE